MLWPIEDIFKGEDVFIIGGGPSLKVFDFDQLIGKRTIGCNSAWRLGVERCEILTFCDNGFWELDSDEILGQYEGMIFACTAAGPASRHPRVWGLPREVRGAHTDKIGFNGNTGFAAINLACIMGAGRIFLLGFDMKLGEEGGRKINNYHSYSTFPANPAVYQKFIRRSSDLKRGLDRHFPHVQVINLNPKSALETFERRPLESVFPNLIQQEELIDG